MSAGWATVKRTRAADRAADTRARTYLSNRYGGRCWRCGTWLEPDTGLAVPTSHVASERFHDAAQRAYPWQVQHIGDCPATPVVTAVSQPPPDVPAGRYAIDGPNGLTFYRVDRPTEGKWAGRTFVSVQAGPNLFPVRDAGARLGILAVIARDPAAASMRYGRELGHCGVCGLELTNQESRARGIGPVCAGKMGW